MLLFIEVICYMDNRLVYQQWGHAFCRSLGKIINQSVCNIMNTDHIPAWHDTQTTSES